ncbi:MAG: thymidylate synthase (FAD), partial [Blastopirellula sp.]
LDRVRIDTLPGGGFVRIVSCMQPVVPRDSQSSDIVPSENWTGDLEVVRNARVSYDADWRTGVDDGKDAKLIHRMITHSHSTPFESMAFTFEVQAPIFVFRQWHRHRTWAYNEISARYALLNLGCYVPNAELLGKQSATDKQMRDIDETIKPGHAAYAAVVSIRENYEQAFARYEKMADEGIPREIARCVLPVNTYSRMFGTVNLHNLFRFLILRLDEHAQHEIRVYAEAIVELVQPICPVSMMEFEKMVAEWKELEKLKDKVHTLK